VAALGWNLLDFDQVREEVLVITDQKEKHMDLVLYSENKPYVGIEVKSLSYGSILNQAEDGIKESVAHLIEDLLTKSKRLNVKYGVLTRFAETIIVDPKTADIIAIFRSPREHLERFDTIRKLLSKPL
jgi:hypothetical protein